MTDAIKNAGASTFDAARNIAGWLPEKVRTAIYSVLATAWALEEIWDLIPEAMEGKLLKTLSILGFGMAAINTVPEKESN